jgi:hypothetical protein
VTPAGEFGGMRRFSGRGVAVLHLVGWTIAFLLLFFGQELNKAVNLYLLLIPVVLLPILVMAIIMIVGLVRSARLGRWWRFSSTLLAPLVFVSLFIGVTRLEITSEWARFQISRPYYLLKIAYVPRLNNEPLFLTFDWGESGGAGVNSVIDTLIYDETDQVGLPPEKRTTEWKQRAEKQQQGSNLTMILAPPTSSVQVTTIAFGHHFFLSKVTW